MTAFTPPLWSLTASQLEDHKTLTTLAGHTFNPKDDMAQALYLWRADVDRALMLKLPVGDDVMASRQRGDHPVKSPALLNAKGKPFTWSPSSINDFFTCPAQYAAKRFYCSIVEKETEAMRQGTIEHKHLEDRLAKKTPLPEHYTRGEKYCAAFEASGAKITAEQELALDENLNFVSWFDKTAWGRCKIDVTLEKDSGRTIAAYDWKTGKVKDDLLQLKINAWLLSLKHPGAEQFVVRYIWLKESLVTPTSGGGEFTRETLKPVAEEILGAVHRMKKAWQSEVFNPKPSGLCRSYCPVTSCPHCGR